jgi:transposase
MEFSLMPTDMVRKPQLKAVMGRRDMKVASEKTTWVRGLTPKQAELMEGRKVMMKRRMLGVDLGIRAPSVAVIADEEGKVISGGIRFELDVKELARVEQEALRGAPEGTKLHVVMEKTFPTCQYVSAFFRGRGHETSFAKPDQVKEFRKCLSPKVKTDERDAHIMSRLPYLDPRQLERIHVASPALQALKMQVSQRASMVKQLVVLKNQLIAYANAVWPGVSKAFGDLDSAHARSFLREQTPKKVLELEPQELVEYLKKRGQIQLAYAQRLAGKLLVLARRAVELHKLLPEQEIELDRIHTVELLEMIETLEERIRAKERELDKALLRCDPEQYLTSIPGIAEKTAPTIFSYFGEPERFPNTRKAQGFVGFYPETDASGDKDRKGTPMTKNGPSLLKRDLFLVSDHFRRLDPQGARLYYDQMVHKGKHHNSALCVVANRMVIPRIVATLREQRHYEFRDFEGKPIDKKQARQLADQWKVTQEVRQRLRNKKRQTNECREGASPQVTSELKAPRNGTPSRQGDSNPDRFTVTRDQIGMLVFRTVEQLLNSGENPEDIRLQLRHEAMKFFQKRT